VLVVLDVLVQKARLVKEVKDVGTSFHGGKVFPGMVGA
jgi:hypothetical protein